MSLLSVTRKLGRRYDQKQEAEARLKDERQRFFDEVSKEVAKGPLAQKVVDYPEVGDLAEWVRVYHPGWVLIEENPEEGTVLLEQDPTKTKFIYINHTDGKVYQRNAIQEASSLDDELLAEEHPELWERITYPIEPGWLEPFREHLKDFLDYIDADFVEKGDIKGYINDVIKPESPRQLLPLEDIEQEDLEVLSEYMVPGQISLRLEKPRNAKPEELLSE